MTRLHGGKGIIIWLYISTSMVATRRRIWISNWRQAGMARTLNLLGPAKEFLPADGPASGIVTRLPPPPPFTMETRSSSITAAYVAARMEKGAGGLAALRLDGFTNLQLGQGRQEGSLTTIPIARGHASQLWVNADCGADGYHSKLSCSMRPQAVPSPASPRGRGRPAYPGDVMANSVQWKQQSDLHAITAQQFQVKVHFVGGQGYPKLYSFGFK